MPGRSTTENVRATYGEPSRTNAMTLEGYDVSEWLYEGERAPRGIRQLAIEFGLLTESGFKPDVIRLFRLDPAPGVFNRRAILAGWGLPTRAGDENGTPVFYYREGLIVYFDKEGWIAQRMVFTLPQPDQNQ